jgi:hypothetical protein
VVGSGMNVDCYVPSSLLPGNRVILIYTKEYERNIDLVSTSYPNLLAATTASSFTSTGQKNYSDD